MAKVQNNLIVHGLSGMIGKQLVIRRLPSGDYSVGAAPARVDNREPTAKEKAHQEQFRQAILYGQGARTNPEYQAPAKARGLSTYNVAVADFLHPPEIQSVDLTGYTGAVGQTLHIKAVDDVKVATVGVAITLDDNTLVEKGQAVVSPQDPHLWTYTTTAAAASASVKVIVDVADLAGHITEETAHT